ncbi:MMK1 [Symbiodinium sp. KB8]|nr:MMK1 [Symbiodinium sp. KB8]
MDRGALQQEYLRRRKLNTFQERRKEGRTAYTKASRTAIIVGSLGLIFNIMAIVLPNWRSSWVALIGYGTRRNWGLLYVQGRQTTFHHTMYDNNCKWYGHLMLGNSCLSPICRWYLLKCNSYFELCLYSYSAALGIIIGTIVQTLCLYWTVALTTRTLRWAANWWPVAAMLNIAGTVFWIIMTEGIFEDLNEESWYPVPPPGLSFILACASAVLQMVNAFLGYTLHYMWPEVDPDNPDQFDSGTDSEDEDAEENG